MTRRISKEIRQKVYEKYNGHCAYCGCKLKYEDMQVDHIESVAWAEWDKKEVNNDIDNLMPSCRQCNFYKGVTNIEGLRYSFENTLKYGIVQYTPHKIEFYFEKCERGDDDG